MARALAALAVLLLGFFFGRATAPAPDPAAPPSGLTPGLTREGAGVEPAYPQTRKGAIAAAAGYQQLFATKAIMAPGELRRRVEAVATPGFVEAMLAANRPGTERLSKGALGQGARQGIPTAFFGVPVAYRVRHYSPARAVVETWGFTVLGNATTAEPAAYFGSAVTALVWMRGAWKIADTRASFGPTPRLLTPRRGGEGFDLLDLVRGMRGYAVAP